ncbi:MAG: response regulator transcription factor [Burkholderiales bacterium]|nr:response regulator transcription factor [Burkholderiales bacterium]
MIRVLIADDHAIVRKGLVQIASESREIEMRGEASEYSSLMRLLKDEPCDVLLLDIAMPGKNGIDVLKVVREQYPRIQVLILSMYPEDQYAIRALKAGAAGYLTKDSAPERLVEAILSVARKKRYITPKVAEMLATHLVTETDGEPHESLSDREFQTMRLIASGKQLSQIADELSLSPKTVSVYRARVLEKMQLKNNAEITHYAIKHGLVE